MKKYEYVFYHDEFESLMDWLSKIGEEGFKVTQFTLLDRGWNNSNYCILAEREREER